MGSNSAKRKTSVHACVRLSSIAAKRQTGAAGMRPHRGRSRQRWLHAPRAAALSRVSKLCASLPSLTRPLKDSANTDVGDARVRVSPCCMRPCEERHRGTSVSDHSLLDPPATRSARRSFESLRMP